mmetsp:Transcript_12876/g.32619  ORF Transcript_12876/g.32619 Transcript_12876/m.32619 type:complete len:228 (+) Transcript_12876:85-768(+)
MAYLIAHTREYYDGALKFFEGLSPLFAATCAGGGRAQGPSASQSGAWAALPGWALSADPTQRPLTQCPLLSAVAQRRPPRGAQIADPLAEGTALPRANASSAWRTLPGWAQAEAAGRTSPSARQPKRQLSLKPDPPENRFDAAHDAPSFEEPALGDDEFSSSPSLPPYARPEDVVHLHFCVCDEPTELELLMQGEALGAPDRVLVILVPVRPARAAAASPMLSAAIL